MSNTLIMLNIECSLFHFNIKFSLVLSPSITAGDDEVRNYALILCVVALSGCNPSTGEVSKLAQKEISDLMKDPGSTTFSDLSVRQIGSGTSGKTAFCVFGKVNSKNSFGSYVGAKDFAITLVTEPVIIPFIEPDYRVASKLVVQDPTDNINYMAIAQLCK